MVISFIAVGDKIKASIINKLIAAVNGTALNGIVPTSVIGAGVTVTPNGQVTFSNATYVGIDGVFSGSYSNYRITFDSTTRSGSGSIQLRLRAAGTEATANYDYVKGYDAGTSRTVSSSSSGGAIPLDQGIAAGQISDGVIDLFGPALTQYTSGTSQSAVLSGSTLTSVQVAFALESTTAYDGLGLYILGGTQTFSGYVRVYGYNTLS